MRADSNEQLRVYWQPGCTACLRMKEFLTGHHVDFESINVLDDPDGLEELVKLAGRRVPIARRGNDWVDGQVLADLARVAGIPWGGAKLLPAETLAGRIDAVLTAVQKLTAQIPEDELGKSLPDRPRTYARLVAHIAQIVESFVDLVERGRRLKYEDYYQEVPPHATSKAGLIAFVESIRARFARWWGDHGRNQALSLPADVYYGKQTLHEYLERTTWHSLQHTRQLALVVETLGLQPDVPFTDADMEGLPMPSHVWDDAKVFAPSRSTVPQ